MNVLVTQKQQGGGTGFHVVLLHWVAFVGYLHSHIHSLQLLPKRSRKINLLMPLKRFEDQKFYVYANIIISNGSLAPD